MFSAHVLAIALFVPAVPPGYEVVNHAHPAHYAQPTIRVFERGLEDSYRKEAWRVYCRELDLLWANYRASGSTPEAWRIYTAAAGDVKRRYVFGDPYLAPIVDIAVPSRFSGVLGQPPLDADCVTGDQAIGK
jgi:hypothetical protein